MVVITNGDLFDSTIPINADDNANSTTPSIIYIMSGGPGNSYLDLMRHIRALEALGTQITVNSNYRDSTDNTHQGTTESRHFITYDEWHRFECRSEPVLISQKELKLQRSQTLDRLAQKQARRHFQAQNRARLTGNNRRR